MHSVHHPSEDNHECQNSNIPLGQMRRRTAGQTQKGLQKRIERCCVRAEMFIRAGAVPSGEAMNRNPSRHNNERQQSKIVAVSFHRHVTSTYCRSACSNLPQTSTSEVKPLKEGMIEGILCCIYAACICATESRLGPLI